MKAENLGNRCGPGNEAVGTSRGQSGVPGEGDEGMMELGKHTSAWVFFFF